MSSFQERLDAVFDSIQVAVERSEAVTGETPEDRRERFAVFMAAMDYQRRERRIAQEQES